MSESDSDSSAQDLIAPPGMVVEPEPEPHPLFKAIRSGDLDEVKRLIAGLPVDCDDLITDTGFAGRTPLERAVYLGRVDILKFLIEKGADINRYGHNGGTPLHNVVLYPKTNDHITCVKVLLAAGADVNATNDWQNSPLDATLQMRYNNRGLHASVPHICRRIVSILLHAGATISNKQRERMGSLFYDDFLMREYLQKILKAGDFKAYAKAHRHQLVAMFVRTRCFQPVPDEIVPLIVDYGFHVGFY